MQQKIRDSYRLDAIPVKDATAAKDRVASNSRRTIRTHSPLIAEDPHYQAKKLLTDPQAAAVFDRLVGKGSGQTLATGTEPQRHKLLGKWLGK